MRELTSYEMNWVSGGLVGPAEDPNNDSNRPRRDGSTNTDNGFFDDYTDNADNYVDSDPNWGGYDANGLAFRDRESCISHHRDAGGSAGAAVGVLIGGAIGSPTGGGIIVGGGIGAFVGNAVGRNVGSAEGQCSD